jgi:hypothetical protein
VERRRFLPGTHASMAPAEGHCLVNLAQGALGEGCIEEQSEQPSDAVFIFPMTRTWGVRRSRRRPRQLAPELHVRGSSRATMKGQVLMLPQSGALSAPMPKGCATCTA